MFKYNKKKIIILIFFDIMFFIAAIVHCVSAKELEPLVFMLPTPALSILLYKIFSINIVMSKYDEAMFQKDYEKADKILTKYIYKYKWLTVLKINLFLIRGESELYLYNYNNFIMNLSKKRLRYYCYLLQIYKIYYDLISGNQIDFVKIQNIKKIKSDYLPKIFCMAIEKYTQSKYDEALNIIKQNSLLIRGEFSQYIYAYVIYICKKNLRRPIDENLKALKKLSYNEYLKNITGNIE